MKCPTCKGTGKISNLDTLGGRILAIRSAFGWSTREAAKFADISPTTWNRAERGHEVTLSALRKIAKALDRNVGWLIGE